MQYLCDRKVVCKAPVFQRIRFRINVDPGSLALGRRNATCVLAPSSLHADISLLFLKSYHTPTFGIPGDPLRFSSEAKTARQYRTLPNPWLSALARRVLRSCLNLLGGSDDQSQSKIVVGGEPTSAAQLSNLI